MHDFDYYRPKTLAEARDLIASLDEAKLLAGGQTLLPTMKQRLAAPSALIDLQDIVELGGIRETGDTIEIGAMVLHADVAAAPVVRSRMPGLADLAGHIGDMHIRNRGTIGGSVANNDPTADYSAGLLALNATIITTEREIVADDFFCGLFTTALEEQEIITAIRIPVCSRFGYARFVNPASRYAAVGVAVAGYPEEIRVAVTGAGQDGVFRWEEAEIALDEDFSPEAIVGLTVDRDMMNDDIHISAEYRAALVVAMTGKAVAAAR